MVAPSYTYDERLWKPCSTKLDYNNFFHAAFGTKNSKTEAYFDRCARLRRKNWENCLSYLQNEVTADIADKAVTVEDIPILATLENVKIVILWESEPNSPNIITPDEDILQDYPYRPTKCNDEVVLFLQDKTFSRMEEQSPSKLNENNVEDQEEEDQGNNVANEPNGYNKGESAGLKGIQYQIGLLIIFLLNALRNLKKWKLSTENKDAGKFDDVVLEWPKGAILLQSKFKENRKITLEDLISDNPKNDDFSLPKYFLFHQKAKAKFKSKHLLIICTNASVQKNTEKYLTLQDVSPKSMLYYESSISKFYTFNEKILPLLKQNSKSYYDKNCKNKEIEESVITEKNLKDFLKRVQFYCNYPPQNGTEEIIEHLLSLNQLQRKMSTREIISKVTDWYQQKKGVYMSYIHAIAKFHEISRDRYYQILEQYSVFFQNKDLDNKTKKQIFHIITETGYLLHELKIYRDLQNNKNKILYLSPNESIDVQKEVLDVFRQLPYIFLVIIWPSGTDDKVINEVCSELNNILKEGRKYKKMFLVAGGNILSRQRELVIDDKATITEYVTFEKLSNDTKNRLLNQEVIIFQGKKVNLNQLFSPKKVEDCPGAVNLETLQKLIKEEEIKVGIPLSNLDEHTNKCYIGRMFRRENKLGNTELKDTEKVRSLSHDIYGPEEKIILIKGSSGMGKTIELAKLAVDLKEKYNDLWVIKLELKDCAGILERCAAEKKRVDIKKLLSFKCTNHLEKCLFSVHEKVIMLLDGIDDVSHYMTLITDVLIQCKNSPNFAKIYITTKPHVTPELEKKLEINPFVLQPFTQLNQEEFLRRCLTYNSELDKNTCEHYANTILTMLSGINSINNNGKHFAAIPLQAKIAADHFQKWIVSNHRDKYNRYLNGDTALNLPEITKLFEALIDKKRGDYINKLNPNGIPEVSAALTKQFDEYITCHEHIAVEVILDETKRKLFSCYRRSGDNVQTLASHMGILQKSDGKFHFHCTTFAEFFFAKKLIRESKVNENKEFQRFFVDDVLPNPNFKVVRTFFNSLLPSERSFNFKNGPSLTPALVDQLEKENCQAILQLFCDRDVNME